VKLQGKLRRDMNRVKMLQEGERVHSNEARNGLRHDGESTKGPDERWQELKALRYYYNQEKNQCIISNFPKCFAKGL